MFVVLKRVLGIADTGISSSRSLLFGVKLMCESKVDVSDAQREATDLTHRAIERWEDEGGAPSRIVVWQVRDSLDWNDIR